MTRIERVTGTSTAMGTSRLHYVPARQREDADASYAAAIIAAATRLGVLRNVAR